MEHEDFKKIKEVPVILEREYSRKWEAVITLKNKELQVSEENEQGFKCLKRDS